METQLLKEILAELRMANSQEPLGFFSSAKTIVYLNRTKCDGFLWYTRTGDINTGIADRSLRGIPVGFACETVERHKKASTKVRLRIKADQDYILEASLISPDGHPVNAGQSLVKSLYALGKCSAPIVLSVSPGTSESVLFVSISANGQRVKTEAGEVTNEMLSALAAWYPDKLFYNPSEEAEESSPATTPPKAIDTSTLQKQERSAYPWLIQRLTEFGVWPAWGDWANQNIANAKQTPESLTLEVAGAIVATAAKSLGK